MKCSLVGVDTRGIEEALSIPLDNLIEKTATVYPTILQVQQPETPADVELCQKILEELKLAPFPPVFMDKDLPVYPRFYSNIHIIMALNELMDVSGLYVDDMGFAVQVFSNLMIDMMEDEKLPYIVISDTRYTCKFFDPTTLGINKTGSIDDRNFEDMLDSKGLTSGVDQL